MARIQARDDSDWNWGGGGKRCKWAYFGGRAHSNSWWTQCDMSEQEKNWRWPSSIWPEKGDEQNCHQLRWQGGSWGREGTRSPTWPCKLKMSTRHWTERETLSQSLTTQNCAWDGLPKRCKAACPGLAGASEPQEGWAHHRVMFANVTLDRSGEAASPCPLKITVLASWGLPEIELCESLRGPSERVDSYFENCVVLLEKEDNGGKAAWGLELCCAVKKILLFLIPTEFLFPAPKFRLCPWRGLSPLLPKPQSLQSSGEYLPRTQEAFYLDLS